MINIKLLLSKIIIEKLFESALKLKNIFFKNLLKYEFNFYISFPFHRYANKIQR